MSKVTALVSADKPLIRILRRRREGLGEPSLALTLPNEPSELDDGLLTASEVAQLELNADWVVLSACNTAAGEKPGAEALSGLAAPSSIRAPARC